jgi:hypothetical protein
MKSILSLSLIAGFLVLSCKKETENKTYNSADSLSATDTTTMAPPPPVDTMAADTARKTSNSKINAANSTSQKIDTITTKK